MAKKKKEVATEAPIVEEKEQSAFTKTREEAKEKAAEKSEQGANEISEKDSSPKKKGKKSGKKGKTNGSETLAEVSHKEKGAGPDGKGSENKGKSEDGSVEKKKGGAFKRILKRYWYWPVAVVVMVTIVVVWLYLMGYVGDRFKQKEAVIVLDAEEANMIVDGYYKIGAYAEGYVVTYGVGDGEFDGDGSVEVDSNSGVVHALKPGIKKVYVYAGNKKKAVRINVNILSIAWRLGVGDEFYASQVRETVGGVFDMTKTNRIDLTGTDVLEERTDDSGRTYYYAAQEGIAVFDVFIEDEQVAKIEVWIGEGVKEENKIFFTNVLEFKHELDLTTNFRQTREVNLGETGTLNDLSFGGGGNIYFLSSDSNALRVYQDGSYKMYKPGTVIATVVIVTGNGYDYYNVRFKAAVEKLTVLKRVGENKEEERPVRVGDTLTNEELYACFWVDGMAYTDLGEYGAFFDYDEETETYTAKRVSNDDTVFIYGYDEDGMLLARYGIVIEEEEEE